MAASLLRGAHSNEVHLRACGVGNVGAEAQPTRGRGLRKDLREARFEKRGLALRKLCDLIGVNVDADDVVTELDHGRRVHRTKVAAPNYR